jgi:hypothetical protein
LVVSVAVAVFVAAGVSVGVFVAAGVTVGVFVTMGVFVAVDVSVAVAVLVAVLAGVFVAVAVAVAVFVGGGGSTIGAQVLPSGVSEFFSAPLSSLCPAPPAVIHLAALGTPPANPFVTVAVLASVP